MPSISEQFSSAAQNQLAAQLTIINALSNSAFGSMQKLLALQINSVKETLENSATATRELLEVKAPQELLAFTAAKAQPNLQKFISFTSDLATISGNARNEFLQAVGMPATTFSATFAQFTHPVQTPFSTSQAAPQNTDKKVSPSKKASAAMAETVEVKEPAKQAKPAAQSAPEAVAKTTTTANKLDAAPETKAETKTATKTVTKAEPKVAAKIATKTEVQPKVKAEASKPAAKAPAKSSVVQSSANTDQTAQPKVETKVEAKVEAKVATKLETPVIKTVKTATKASPAPKANEVKAAELKAETVKADAVKAVEVKPADVKAEVVKAEAVKAEVVKAEAVKTEAVKAEPVAANPANTVTGAAQALPETTTTEISPANEETKLSVTGLPTKPLAKSGFPGTDRPAFKAKSSSATGAKMRVRQ